MRQMKQLIKPCKKYAVIYIDDILNFSWLPAEPICNVDMVFTAIRAA
jgi:hypothetical protein